jgi:hypothetical protein
VIVSGGEENDQSVLFFVGVSVTSILSALSTFFRCKSMMVEYCKETTKPPKLWGRHGLHLEGGKCVVSVVTGSGEVAQNDL